MSITIDDPWMFCLGFDECYKVVQKDMEKLEKKCERLEGLIQLASAVLDLADRSGKSIL